MPFSFSSRPANEGRARMAARYAAVLGCVAAFTGQSASAMVAKGDRDVGEGEAILDEVSRGGDHALQIVRELREVVALGVVGDGGVGLDAHELRPDHAGEEDLAAAVGDQGVGELLVED